MENLKKENIENIEQHDPSKEKDDAAEFSLKLIGALEEKFKTHNKENPNSKSTLQQLKKVYIQGANQFKVAKDPHGSLNLWGLARVNMYLGYKSGRKISIEPEKKASDKMDELSFQQIYCFQNSVFSKKSHNIITRWISYPVVI